LHGLTGGGLCWVAVIVICPPGGIVSSLIVAWGSAAATVSGAFRAGEIAAGAMARRRLARIRRVAAAGREVARSPGAAAAGHAGGTASAIPADGQDGAVTAVPVASKGPAR